MTGALNVRMPLGSSVNGARFLKFGAKIKDKRKTRNFEIGSASPLSTVLFPALQDTSFDNSEFLSFFNTRYDKFPGINADASRAMFNALPAGRFNINSCLRIRLALSISRPMAISSNWETCRALSSEMVHGDNRKSGGTPFDCSGRPRGRRAGKRRPG